MSPQDTGDLCRGFPRWRFVRYLIELKAILKPFQVEVSPKWRVRFNPFNVLFDVTPLVSEELCDGIPKSSIADPVS